MAGEHPCRRGRRLPCWIRRARRRRRGRSSGRRRPSRAAPKTRCRRGSSRRSLRPSPTAWSPRRGSCSYSASQRPRLRSSACSWRGATAMPRRAPSAGKGLATSSVTAAAAVLLLLLLLLLLLPVVVVVTADLGAARSSSYEPEGQSSHIHESITNNHPNNKAHTVRYIFVFPYVNLSFFLIFNFIRHWPPLP